RSWRISVLGDGRGRGHTRRRRPDDHAEPAGGAERVQPRAARRARRGVEGGARPRGPSGRDHGCRTRLQRGPGPDRVQRDRRHPRDAAGDVSPQRARHPRAREAGDRGRERRLRRRGTLARVRLRHPARRRQRALRTGLRRHRARARRGRHLLPQPAARRVARIRVDVVQPAADRGRGSRVGTRVRGGRGGDAARARSRARGALRRSPDAWHRHDEAALRPRANGDARGAARARGAAPGGGDADRGLPGGRCRLPREARAALQRAVTSRVQTWRPRPSDASRAAREARSVFASATWIAGYSRRSPATARPRIAFTLRRSATSQRRTASASRDGGFSASRRRSADSYTGSVFRTYATTPLYVRGGLTPAVAPRYAVQTASAFFTKSPWESVPSPQPATSAVTPAASARPRRAPGTCAPAASRRRPRRRAARRTARWRRDWSSLRARSRSARPRDSRPASRTRFRRGNRESRPPCVAKPNRARDRKTAPAGR